MNMVAKIARANILRGGGGQAEKWFARSVDPGCTATDRDAFEKWRSSDPAHADAYRRVEELWSASDEAIQHDPALMAASRRALRVSSPRHGRRWAVASALGAAAMIAVVMLAAPDWLPYLQRGADYHTAIGQQRTISLEDGTHIILDTNSEVRVRYGKDARRVQLLRGRAQFNVHANRQRPFVVHARDGTVTDIGTRFQVNLKKDDVNVTLLDGRVAVTTRANGKTRHASLAPGQQLNFNSRGVISPARQANVKFSQGWTRGKLFVHGWPLPRLIRAMNRYNSTQMVIGSPSLRHLRISGVFHVRGQKALLLALEQGWSVKATRTDDGHIVLSK